MELVENLVLVAHVAVALAIIGLVLVQQGKGAEMGAGFGSGSSGTVFGSLGAGNFLTKATSVAAVLFFVSSFSLAYFAAGKTNVSTEVGIPVVEQTIDINEVEMQESEPILPQSTAEEVELPVLGEDIGAAAEQAEESVESELPELE